MADREDRAVQYLGLALGAVGLFITYKGLTGGSSSAAKPAPEPRRILAPGEPVLLIGDSIGVGIERPLRERLEAYGSHLDALVKIGTTARYWSTHLDGRDGGYPVILVSLGSNDVALGPEQEDADLAHLAALLQSRGNAVYWITPPSFRQGAFKPKQQLWADMMRDHGIPELDLDGPQPSVEYDPMRLHLTPDGYAQMAGQIVDALKRWR
jgi:hypothetical protein